MTPEPRVSCSRCTCPVQLVRSSTGDRHGMCPGCGHRVSYYRQDPDHHDDDHDVSRWEGEGGHCDGI